MNFFIEGLQGSGKSTLVQKLADKYKDCVSGRRLFTGRVGLVYLDEQRCL